MCEPIPLYPEPTYYVYKRSDGYINCSEFVPRNSVYEGNAVTFEVLEHGLTWAEAIRAVERHRGLL